MKNFKTKNGLFTGNVGIGTTNPGARLDIKGDGSRILISSDDYRLASIGRKSSNTADSAYLTLNSLGVAQCVFDAEGPSYILGNVGIGTTSPGQGKLVTTGYGGNPQTRSFVAIRHNNNVESYFRIARMGSADSTSVSLANNYNRDVPEYQADDNTEGVSDITFRDDGSLSFSTEAAGASGPTEKMRITSDGNVGIGTTSPSSSLTVQNSGGTNSYVLRVSGNNTEKNNIAGIFDTHVAGTDRSAGSLALSESSSVSSVWISAYPGSNSYINNGGNVGIGTTNPSANLHIVGDNAVSGSQGFIKISNNVNGDSGIIGDSIALMTGGAANQLAIRSGSAGIVFGVGSNPKMIIDSGGNVGIGTTSPGYKMDVVSSQSTYVSRLQNDGLSGLGLAINITSTSSSHPILNCLSSNISRFRVQADGTAYTSSTLVTSDDRVKHNEQPIVGALETLLKVTPKKYIKTAEMYDVDRDFELDADGNPVDENGEPVEHRIEAGVIAQQVLTVDELAFAVSPEGVDEDGVVTSPHSLDYNSLFTYAIAAIQEQQQLIESQKQLIESQQSTVDDLISRVESLES